MNASQMDKSLKGQRRPWVRPALQSVGTVGKILEGGTGKSSITLADSGDSRKPNGQSKNDGP